jgi:hypothetical protein
MYLHHHKQQFVQQHNKTFAAESKQCMPMQLLDNKHMSILRQLNMLPVGLPMKGQCGNPLSADGSAAGVREGVLFRHILSC